MSWPLATLPQSPYFNPLARAPTGTGFSARTLPSIPSHLIILAASAINDGAWGGEALALWGLGGTFPLVRSTPEVVSCLACVSSWPWWSFLLWDAVPTQRIRRGLVGVGQGAGDTQVGDLGVADVGLDSAGLMWRTCLMAWLMFRTLWRCCPI